jgi:hypothetical protein
MTAVLQDTRHDQSDLLDHSEKRPEGTYPSVGLLDWVEMDIVSVVEVEGSEMTPWARRTLPAAS